MTKDQKKDRDMIVIVLGALFHAAVLATGRSDPTQSLNHAENFVAECEKREMQLPGGAT